MPMSRLGESPPMLFGAACAIFEPQKYCLSIRELHIYIYILYDGCTCTPKYHGYIYVFSYGIPYDTWSLSKNHITYILRIYILVRYMHHSKMPIDGDPSFCLVILSPLFLSSSCLCLRSAQEHSVCTFKFDIISAAVNLQQQ